MEKLTVTTVVEINRYVMKRNDFDINELQCDLECLIKGKIYYNKNNSGERDFYNILGVETVSLNNLEDIKKLCEEGQSYGMISFYRENGWDGVYLNTEEDCLTRKCNNWVHNGQDGFMYLIIGKNLEEFAGVLQVYINEGLSCYNVYDNKEGEYLDRFQPLNDIDIQEMKDYVLKEYGIEDFNTWEL